MRNSTVNIGSVYGPQRNRLSITLNKKHHIWWEHLGCIKNSSFVINQKDQTPKKIKQASLQAGAPREKHFEFPSSHTLAVDPKNVKHLYKINEQQKLCRKRDNMLVLTTTREKNARNSKVFKYGKEKRQGTGNKTNCTP